MRLSIFFISRTKQIYAKILTTKNNIKRLLLLLLLLLTNVKDKALSF